MQDQVDTAASATVAALKDAHWHGARGRAAVDLRAFAAQVGAQPVGPDAPAEVPGITTMDRPQPGYAFFVDRMSAAHEPFLDRAAEAGMTAICPASDEFVYAGPVLRVGNVRATVAALIEALFPNHLAAQSTWIHETAQIDPTAEISVGTVVGAGSVIGPGTRIFPNVVIAPRVRIGRDCMIKSGTVIGQGGFGIYRDDGGRRHHLPHVGGVVIGDGVDLGALNTVVSGTFHPTVVGDTVKTDDHVHIAHNCVIGNGSLLTACAELSGSVSMGQEVWVGPNAAIKDGLSIGDNAFIGIGSVVVRDVPAGLTVFGSPARAAPGSKGGR